MARWPYDPVSGDAASCPTLQSQVTVSSVDHDAFPGLSVTDVGGIRRWCIMYREGTDHGSPSFDGDIYRRVSTDNGDTWSTKSAVITDANEDLRGAELTTLSDNRVVATISTRDTSGNRILDGGYTVISSDGGDTWGTPTQIDSDFTSHAQSEFAVVELPNGDWLLPVIGKDTGHATNDWSVRMLKSTDDGATWTTIGTLADGDADSRQYNETSVVRNPDDGQLIAVIRDETTERFYRTTSDDDGVTWTALTAVMDTDHNRTRPTMVLRNNGDIFAVIRDWSADIAADLMRSTDLGVTWEVCEQLDPGDLVYGQPVETPEEDFAVAYAIENEAREEATIYFQREAITVTVESIDDLTDVDTVTTAPSSGDHLEWDGSNWVPADPPSGGGSGEILISDTPSTPLVFADLVQNEDQDDLVYAD